MVAELQRYLGVNLWKQIFWGLEKNQIGKMTKIEHFVYMPDSREIFGGSLLWKQRNSGSWKVFKNGIGKINDLVYSIDIFIMKIEVCSRELLSWNQLNHLHFSSKFIQNAEKRKKKFSGPYKNTRFQKTKMAADFGPKISFYFAEFTILIFVSGIQYNFWRGHQGLSIPFFTFVLGQIV